MSNKKYIIRQYHNDKKHWYYTGKGVTEFSQRICDAKLFDNEAPARDLKHVLHDEFEDLQVVAVKVNITVYRS